MNRRKFLTVLGSGAAAATLPGISKTLFAQESVIRPNIVFIFTDDVTKRDFGCYGSPVVRTPRIDQLAREGMKFAHMFTPAPLCAPSRYTLYTGLYPIRNGGHPNHSEVKPGIKSIAHYLAALDYRVILLGKRHIKPQNESFPFEYYEDQPLGYNPGKDLPQILANPGDKPFCLFYVKGGAHDTWPNRNPTYTPDEVDIPPYHVDTPETRRARARYYSNITLTDTSVGKILDLLKEHHLEDNTLVIYTSDHGTGWPHEKFNLYDAGTNVPFVVRWPGRIKPGTTSEALTSFVDIVPTFIDIAGGKVAEVVSDCGGQTLDGKSFLPVLLGERTEHHEEIFACLSWDVTWAYPMRAVRTKTHKYIWNIDSHFKYNSGWASELDIHKKQGKWDIWKSWVKKAETDPHASERVRAELYRPPEELYDLTKDPDEMVNLAHDPASQNILASLRENLKAWMKSQGDKGDSAYHREKPGQPRFLDGIYCRQPVVYCKMKAVGGPLTDKAEVELMSFVWQAQIRYTLDGSDPTRTSSLYTEPFKVDPPVTIKAKGFWEGGETPLKVVEFPVLDFRFRYDGHYKPCYR